MTKKRKIAKRSGQRGKKAKKATPRATKKTAPLDEHEQTKQAFLPDVLSEKKRDQMAAWINRARTP